MLGRTSIAMAIVSVAFVISQRSVAQTQCTDPDPIQGPVSCVGGKGCSDYTAWEPMPVNYGEGYFWIGQIVSCPGNNSCKVTNWIGPGDPCYGTDLRKKETRDQFAELSLSQNAIIADCQGHARQYRSLAAAGPGRDFGRDVSR